MNVTGGKTDEHLARLAIRSSEECLSWMIEHGMRLQPSLSGTLSLARTNAFFLGGGKSLVNASYRTAARLGVEVQCSINDTKITSLWAVGETMAGSILGQGCSRMAALVRAAEKST